MKEKNIKLPRIFITKSSYLNNKKNRPNQLELDKQNIE